MLLIVWITRVFNINLLFFLFILQDTNGHSD